MSSGVSEEKGQFDRDGYALYHHVLDEDLVEEDLAVDIVLEAGGVSVHHPNIVHGSKPNTSGGRRCGLTIRYIPANTYRFEDAKNGYDDYGWYDNRKLSRHTQPSSCGAV
jgi:ectoine hydroxylase-related dioxygenase (phytanoyl-CoA dioxygenase family)